MKSGTWELDCARRAGGHRTVIGAPAVVFRSIRSADAADLQAFHRRLSDDTVRNRFFGAHRELSDQEAHRFTSLTAGEETAVVGTLNGRIIAVARSVRLGGGDTAEVAFVVEDGYQHRGIGTTLLALLARFGWTDGVRRFVADTFASNRSMLDVFMHSPCAVTVVSTRRDASVIHLVMVLSEPPGLPASTSARGSPPGQVTFGPTAAS
jgi:RimJ/RimL family protein N-acetyltransferase